MIKIEIEQEAAEVLRQLRAQAEARRIPFEQFLRELAGNGTPVATAGDASMDEFDRWLDELSEGTEGLPGLPPDFSRADIYDDHD